MLKSVLSITFLFWINLIIGSHALAQPRIALVIGNSSYQSAPLPNPASDADLMATTLEDAGFSVTKIIDADQKTMKRALIEFGRELRKSNAVGLFYYAGHGVQMNGQNYLIPIGTNIQDETEVEIEAINVNSFLGTMERSSSAINIVILDACRNNPFTRSFRSATRGLARVTAPRGSYIAYATAPGQVAYDGDLGNSPYTLALTRAISTPNLTIEQVFKQARREVLATTKDKQIPWENSSITGDFYFKQQIPQPVMASVGSKPVPPALIVNGKAFELAFWEPEEEDKTRSLFKSYLQKYPKEKFSTTAVALVKERNFKKHSATKRPIPSSSTISKREPLTRMIQKELTRVGCSPGVIDGKWGPSGRSALKKFNHFANKNLKTSGISRYTYHAIRSKASRVCPRSCTDGSFLKSGKCVSDVASYVYRSEDISKLQLNCGIFNGSRFCQ